MAVTTGTIISSNPSIPISADIRVQAFDQDMRSEQLLGEVTVPKPPSSTAPVFYTITYDADHFLHDYKYTADLIVIATTLDGRLSARSEIIFNARDR